MDGVRKISRLLDLTVGCQNVHNIFFIQIWKKIQFSYTLYKVLLVENTVGFSVSYNFPSKKKSAPEAILLRLPR